MFGNLISQYWVCLDSYRVPHILQFNVNKLSKYRESLFCNLHSKRKLKDPPDWRIFKLWVIKDFLLLRTFKEILQFTKTTNDIIAFYIYFQTKMLSLIYCLFSSLIHANLISNKESSKNRFFFPYRNCWILLFLILFTAVSINNITDKKQ